MMSLDQPAPIQFLSQVVKNQLRSGVATPSVVQCVEELVVNSIDAGASCIAVRVDLPDCKIQVIDNGRGVTKDDMSYIGERYATSKCHDMKDLENISQYGYRGEALASIREIASVLEISSRARGSEVTYSKLFRHGKDQGVSRDPKVRPSGGTTVTAHNVFYNLPVRRKMLCSPLAFEQICKRLQAISLIHPQISLTLRNDSTGVKSIQTHSCSSVVQTFGYLFGKDIADGLMEVNHIHQPFNISGFIGTTGHRNKSLQFVFVNGRLVLKTKLHKLINDLLGNSLVTKNKGKSQDTTQGSSVKSSSTTCQSSPGGNQMEYGIFVLNITCARNEYDITLDPSKTLIEFRDWEASLTCVHELVTSFLQREHLTMKLTPAQTGIKDGSQEGTPLSNDDLVLKDTDVRAISTTDCKNAVQSTCVRRQTSGILEPNVIVVMEDQNPCVEETVVDRNGAEDVACSDESSDNHHKLPDAFGDASNDVDECAVTHLDLTETPIPRSELDFHADREKSLSTCTSTHADPEPFGGIWPTSPVETTNADKQADIGPVKTCSEITDVSPCHGGENKTTKAALSILSSSEPDAGSSEETLSSSEVEMGTPKSNARQCCDGHCMSFRKEHADSGPELVDLISPRTKLAVKARNSLSMFRRSVKKKRLAKTAKDDPSKKSGQKINKQLQFVTASEHKTIALRWHRSPGFRSRLEGLNVKCKERQDSPGNPVMSVLHHKLSSSSETNQQKDVVSAPNTLSGDSQKEVCQSSQQANTNGNTEPDNQRKGLIVTEIFETTGAFEHVDCKRNVSTVHIVEKEVNRVEDEESSVKDLDSHILIDAPRDECTDLTHEEHSVQGKEGMDAHVPYIPSHSHSKTESTRAKKREADLSISPISPKEQKKEVHCTRNVDSQASSEIPRKFLTSNSFMVSASDVFGNREPSETSNQTYDCTQICCSELKPSSNQSAGGAVDALPHPSEKIPLAVLSTNETEPFSVHMEGDIADDSRDPCRKVDQDETLGDGTSYPLVTGDTTRTEASGIQEMNEVDILVDDKPRAVKSLSPECSGKKSEESNVVMTSEPDALDENVDLMDASDADDSISLFHIPHEPDALDANVDLIDASDADESISLFHVPQQDEESLCVKVKSCQELISLIEQPNEERVDDVQFTETSMTKVASPSPTAVHQNSDELDVTIDLPCAPEATSAGLDKPVHTLSIEAPPAPSAAHQNNTELDITTDLPCTPEATSARQDKPVHTLSVEAPPAPSAVLQNNGKLDVTTDLPCTPEVTFAGQDEPVHTLSVEAPLAPSAAHQNNSELDITTDLPCTPEATSARRDKPVHTLSVEAPPAPSAVLQNNGKLDVTTDLPCTPEVTFAGQDEPVHTLSVEAPLAPSAAHQNNSELDVTSDLHVPCDPEVTSAGQDKPVPTLCVEADELETSSKDDQTTESERAFEPFHTAQDELMDAKNSLAGTTNAEFVIESREWYSVYDTSKGMKVFINRFNGNCSFEKPEEGPASNQELGHISEDVQFSMVTKSDTLAHPHLPHSAAPFVNSLRDKRELLSHSSDPPLTPGTMATIDAALEDSQGDDDELAVVKWGKSSRMPATDGAPQFSKYDDPEIGCRFSRSIIGETLSNVDAKFQAKVLSSLNPCQFTKQMFSSIMVLGQVDAKFIACLVNSDYDKNPAGEPNLLILVDQHAAHERIRLEMLTQEAYTRTGVDTDGIDVDEMTRSIRSSDITPALPVSLSQSELRLMEAYNNKMKKFGIEYTMSKDSVMVTGLPACVLEKEATELKRGRHTVASTMAETLIKEVLDSLQHQSGAVSSLPKTITKILNSQACHGAIKFGDTLDLSECKTLIGQLSSCDLPFQCAHGRPALMPILDFKKMKLGNFEKVTPSPPQVWKLKYLSLG